MLCLSKALFSASDNSLCTFSRTICQIIPNDLRCPWRFLFSSSKGWFWPFGHSLELPWSMLQLSTVEKNILDRCLVQRIMHKALCCLIVFLPNTVPHIYSFRMLSGRTSFIVWSTYLCCCPLWSISIKIWHIVQCNSLWWLKNMTQWLLLLFILFNFIYLHIFDKKCNEMMPSITLHCRSTSLKALHQSSLSSLSSSVNGFKKEENIFQKKRQSN